MVDLPENDRIRLAKAVAEVERKTSGEIVIILAAESASYYHVPFLWASLFAFLIPWPLIYYTWWSVQWIFFSQLIIFLLMLLLTFPKTLRYRLVSRRVKFSRAHRRAVEQFLVQNMHTTKGRTGVLLYVSLAEAYAEIIADSAIDQKVEDGTWQSIIDTLTTKIAEGKLLDGLLLAVERVGSYLALHFPPGSSDPDELPNHVILLSS